MDAPQLTAYVRTLEERLTNAINLLNGLGGECKSAAQAHGELKQQVDRVLPVLEEAMKGLKMWKDEEDKEREAYINLKRDVVELKKWKDEHKAEVAEKSRRKAAFGPNVTAAIITFAGGIIIVVINLVVTYSMIRKP